jgi:hypothetical protein
LINNNTSVRIRLMATYIITKNVFSVGRSLSRETAAFKVKYKKSIEMALSHLQHNCFFTYFLLLY